MPIFCEQPLTGELEASELIAAEARRRGVPIRVGCHRRFDPGFVAAREAMASGQMGTLYAATSLSFDHHLPRPELLADSGGVWRDLHVKDFDLLRWVTGLEVVSVCALGSVRADEGFRACGDADTTSVSGVMEEGVLMTVRGVRHDPRGQDVRLELLGSSDSIAAGFDRRAPLHGVGPGGSVFDGPAYDDFLDRFGPAFAAETAAFVMVASGGRAKPCPPSEDLAAFRVALACERSVASGSVQMVEHEEEMKGSVPE